MAKVQAAAGMIVATLAVLPAPVAAQEIELTGDLTPKVAQQRTEALCTAADQLTGGLEAKQARRMYLRALRTGARDTRCAVTGLKRLAREAKDAAADAPKVIAKAQALERQGYTAEAEKLVATALAADPKVTIPDELRKDERAIDTAEKLAAEGYEGEAQKEVQGAVAANPEVVVPRDLQQLERKPGWLRSALGSIGTWLTGAVIMIGIVLLAALIGRMIWAHVRRRIVTEPLVGGDEKWRDVLYAEMRQRFQSWGEGPLTNRLAVSAGPMEGLKGAADVGSLVPQANTILDLVGAIDRVVPGRTWQLRGYLMPAEPERGVGVALTLSQRTSGTIFAAETLKEADYLALPKCDATDDDKALAWRRLGLAGAALLLFEDCKNRRVAKGDLERLGTKSWKAYAMATSAATYYEWDLETSRRLYRQALALDDGYRDARFNLAVVNLKLAQGDRDALARVDKQLSRLVDELDPVKDTLWYRAQLWRVILRIQREDYGDACDEAETLFAAMSWWHARGALKRFLNDAFAGSLPPLAVALELSGRTASAELAGNLRTQLALEPGDVTGAAIVKALKADPVRCSQGAYALAGYYAVCREEDTWLDYALEQLEIALDRGGPDMARLAWDDYMLHNLRDDVVVSRFRDSLRSAGWTPNGGPAPPPEEEDAGDVTLHLRVRRTPAAPPG